MRNLGAYKGFRGLACVSPFGAEVGPTTIIIYRDGLKFQEVARLNNITDKDAIYEFRYYIDNGINKSWRSYSDLIDTNVPYQDMLPR